MKCRVRQTDRGSVGLPRELVEQLGDPGEMEAQVVAEGLLLRPLPRSGSIGERAAAGWAAYFATLDPAQGFTDEELQTREREREQLQRSRDERILNLFDDADLPA